MKKDELIDFVVLWVDGSDPKWLEKKKKYKPDLCVKDEIVRYRDWGFFNYWFRAVEQYAPWVHHIYLVTDEQVPEWLNTDNSKLTVVDHTEIIDKEYLPTFNASAIELNIHKIPGLSEHFVYFNDDTFLGAPTKPADYFKDGKPVDAMILNASTGMNRDEQYAYLQFNNAVIINRHFDKRKVVSSNPFNWLNLKYGKFLLRTITQMGYPYFSGFKPMHMPTPMLVSTYEKIWDVEGAVLNETTSHKFRHRNDVNQNLISTWQACEGKMKPKSAYSVDFLEIEADNIESCCKKIIRMKKKQFCLNDKYSGHHYERDRLMIEKAFEKKYPKKSSYEK